MPDADKGQSAIVRMRSLFGAVWAVVLALWFFWLVGWEDIWAAAAVGVVGIWSGARFAQLTRPAPPPDPPPRDQTESAIPWMILEKLPDPVILIDRSRVVVAANQLARDLFDVDMVGVDLARTLRHPAVLEAVDGFLAGRPHRPIELSLPVPLRRFFTLHAFDLDVEGAQPGLKCMLVLHEMTIARRAEEMHADFIANVSHELRSPLSALIGFIETLKGPAREDVDARERFLEIMQRESNRMARLIDDLLSLSRVEANEHVRPSSRVDLGAILGNVAEIISGVAKEKGMSVRLDIDLGLPEVAGEQDELTQVFQNLADNAVKYGAENTEIQIAARPVDRIPETGGRGVAVAVTDKGEGIPPEHLSRVTERFFRTDKARSRGLGGTGLGLAIVKHIVGRHRGRLNVESVEGEGSVFTVFLPLGRNDAGKIPVDNRSESPGPS